MGFFSRKKFKLPKFPPNVAPIFRQLCEVIDQDGLNELRLAIDDTINEAYQNQGVDSQVDLESAEQLGDCCRFLLDQYDNYPPAKQALIIGAVRYFAIGDDPLDDKIFATGFHDDKQIVNHVLEELGIEDRYFDLT